MQTLRGQPRKTRRRVAPAAAAGSAVATRDTPTAPDDSIGPDADTGSTAFVTPESTLADTIATAAVLRQLEQSGRLLPARPVTPAVADDVAEAEPQSYGDALSLDSAEVDVDAALSGILGGESYTPLPSYNVFNRPLGADLSDTLKSKIRRGDYVNLQLLLSSDNDDDELEQQHQRLTLEVRPSGNQDNTLSLMKSSRTKEITTIDQWVAAFTIYGAVLTESFPQLAPGVFKHISDITEMARRFGGMAWWHYDKTYRKEMGANHLNYGQINWDLRFRCLERASNKPGVYPFRGNQSRNTHVKSRGGASSALGKGFQKGQCYQFEQFASCAKPACQFKHACAKCSGKHPTSRCTARPQGAGAGRPANVHKQ